MAKVSLWINCAVDNQPLAFLDHKIVCGDSLVGWPLFNQLKYIPEGAYNPPKDLKGPENKEKRQKYRDARDANREFLSEYEDFEEITGRKHKHPTLDLKFLPIPEIQLPEYPKELLQPDQGPEDILHKSKAWNDFRSGNQFKRLQLAADIWTAAFFWSPDYGDFPTTKDFIQAHTQGTYPNQHQLSEILKPLRPLHWPLVFYDIHQRGGFDLVIGNPPWQRLRGSKVTDSEPGLPTNTYYVDKKQIAILVNYFKASETYHSFTGEPTLYLIFTNQIMSLINSGGGVSIVLKSGIFLDKTNRHQWQMILDSNKQISVFDFKNNGVFPNVALAERVCILSVNSVLVEEVRVRMLCRSLEEYYLRTPVILSRSEIRLIKPYTNTLPTLRNAREKELALSIHRLHPIFDISKVNNWEARLVSMFGPVGSSYYLRDNSLKHGWTMNSSNWLERNGEFALPVYEAQLINCFDHRSKSYQFYKGQNKYGKKPFLRPVPCIYKVDSTFETESRYWIKQDLVEERIAQIKNEPDDIIIGYRDTVDHIYNQRVSKASIIPNYPTSDSIPVIIVPKKYALDLLAVLNSSVFEFMARVHLPSTHMAKSWILSQIPVPNPGFGHKIGGLAECLQMTSISIINSTLFTLNSWDCDSRNNILSLLDALIAKYVYRINGRNIYEFILDSLDVLCKAEIKELGEYRFKRLCLEAWDQI